MAQAKKLRAIEEEPGEYVILRFDLKKHGIKGCRDHNRQEITSFTLREVDGNDETIALQAATQLKGKSSGKEELIKQALIAVNDVAVEEPYDGFNRWNTKAREVALKAFDKINSTTEENLLDFLSDGQLTTAPRVAPPLLSEEDVEAESA